MAGRSLVGKEAGAARGEGAVLLEQPPRFRRAECGAETGSGSGVMTSEKTDRDGNALAAGVARPVSYGRKGALEVRLACSAKEIDAAQAVRYRVFYDEMSAPPDA